MTEPVPYCGLPPLGGEWIWNLDPVLIAALLLVGGWHMSRLDQASRKVKSSVLAGWILTGLAFVSPLCNLSVALFSARVGQHMVLVLAAAPLVAAGGLAGPLRTAPWSAVAMFAVALWSWHLPVPYEATFRSDLIYWVMHLSLFGAAVWLWAALFALPARALGTTLAIGVLTGLHMAALGALLTFAGRSWYAVHAVTTAPWGFTALEDQQFGGLIMWVPAGLLVAVLAVVEIGRALAVLDRHPDRAS